MQAPSHRRLRLPVTVLAFMAAVSVALPAMTSERAAPDRPWEELEPGLHYRQDRLPPAAEGLPITLYMIRADLGRFAAAVRAAPPSRLRVPLKSLEQDGDIAIINGGYFEADGRPSGLVRSAGQTHAKIWGGGSGALLLWGPKASIIFKRDYPKENEPPHALQAGPVMVEPDGLPGIRSRSGKRERRTFVALLNEKTAVLGASSGPVDLYDLAEHLRTAVGVRSALNLDGGPSAGFYLRHPVKSVVIEPDSAIPNAIAITRQDSAAQSQLYEPESPRP